MRLLSANKNVNMKITKLYPVILLMLVVLVSCINSKTKEQKPEILKDPMRISESYLDSLDKDFQKQYEKGHLPGFALSIFTSEKILFQKGYGFANIEDKKEMNIQTVQGVASISKTLIAVSLMKTIELNKISLGDNINEILPFKVINPDFEHIPITIQQLATHTSSISDEGNYDKAYVFEEALNKEKFPKAWGEYIDIYNKNSSMQMEDYLERVFRKGGEWETDKNFIKAKPEQSMSIVI